MVHGKKDKWIEFYSFLLLWILSQYVIANILETKRGLLKIERLEKWALTSLLPKSKQPAGMCKIRVYVKNLLYFEVYF